MAKLAPMFRMIARDVALGCSLEDISALRNVPLAEIKRVTRGGTFLKAVEVIQKEIDSQVIAEEAADPVRRKMQVHAMKAAERMIVEVDNEDGGSAGTRIKASQALLDMTGYGKTEDVSSLAVIMLSPGKLKAVQNTDSMVLGAVPDMVDGMPS